MPIDFDAVNLCEVAFGTTTQQMIIMPKGLYVALVERGNVQAIPWAVVALLVLGIITYAAITIKRGDETK